MLVLIVRAMTGQIVNVRLSNMVPRFGVRQVCVINLRTLPELPFSAIRLSLMWYRLVSKAPRVKLPLLGQCASLVSLL